MERMFRHGRGLVEVSTNDGYASRRGVNSNRSTGIGHGYGQVKLEKTGTNMTARFASSSPAFEVNNSLGYAFGHGRCFYRRPEPYIDQFLFFQMGLIDMIDTDSDNDDDDDDEDTSSSSSSTNVSSESNDDDDDEQYGDSLSSSSRPDSGIGL